MQTAKQGKTAGSRSPAGCVRAAHGPVKALEEDVVVVDAPKPRRLRPKVLLRLGEHLPTCWAHVQVLFEAMWLNFFGG